MDRRVKNNSLAFYVYSSKTPAIPVIVIGLTLCILIDTDVDIL